ncbi:MAG: FtsX-like permease family protein [Opitutaceae bacterium]
MWLAGCRREYHRKPRAQRLRGCSSPRFRPNCRTSLIVRPKSRRSTRPGGAMWWVIFAAGVFLFAISCLNAMNLMLVRVLGRMRELSIRLAVGCGRARIARLFLIDGAVLTTASGGIVLLVARWWFHPLFALVYGDPVTSSDFFADWVIAGSVTGLCLVTALAIALLPILQISKADLVGGLKAGGASTGDNRHRGRLRSAFVAIQAALAVILLVGTGLMMRTVQRLQAVDLGFDPTGKVKVELVFPPGFEPKPAARLQYFERLRERVAAIPGVKSAAFGEDALLVGGYHAPAPNFEMKDGKYQSVAVSFLSAAYAETAGMKLKRGRWFSDRSGEQEAVINETLARFRFGDEDPIGQSFKFRGYRERQFQVVGVVRDVRETVRDAAGMRFYLPDSGAPTAVSALILRLDHESGPAFKGMVRRTIYDFDPMLITNYVASLHERAEGSLHAERLTLVILRGLAVIALTLAVIGLGSVMAYSVGARTREFGVRLALGAPSANLYRLVLKRGMATVTLGVLIGTAVAIAATRFLQTLLFETASYEPGVYLAVTGILLLSGAFACWLPARRAAKVDPMVALRAE